MSENLDLQISRYLAAPRAKLWRAWSDPKLLVQWWCPKPWTTELRGFEFRTGGAFYTFMRGPDENGGEGTSDNPGVFLEVTPEERIVFTTCLTEGYRPIETWMPMTAIFTLTDEGEGTRYVARCLHGDVATAKKHKAMGFFEGWGTCVTQIEELAKTL